MPSIGDTAAAGTTRLLPWSPRSAIAASGPTTTSECTRAGSRGSARASLRSSTTDSRALECERHVRGGLDPGRVHLRRVGIQAEAELRAQGVTHGSVDRLAAHLAGRHGIGERLAEVAGGRHLDVEPRLHRGHRAARSEYPVGLDKPWKQVAFPLMALTPRAPSSIPMPGMRRRATPVMRPARPGARPTPCI